jgi:hypothetical protein
MRKETAHYDQIPLVPPFAKGDVNPRLLIPFKRFVLDKSAFFKGENFRRCCALRFDWNDVFHSPRNVLNGLNDLNAFNSFSRAPNRRFAETVWSTPPYSRSPGPE